MELTQARLKEVLCYAQDTGGFSWIKGRRGVSKTHFAGCFRPRGDVYICINYKRYLAHQLAWLYMTGEWPAQGIDHKNRCPGDNRWSNLRLSSVSENGANQPARTPSGLKGAYKTKGRRWWAAITIKGKFTYLGMFDSAEEAHSAYMAEAKLAFREFASN